jgi:hypothetical protein
MISPKFQKKFPAIAKNTGGAPQPKGQLHKDFAIAE